MLARKKLEKGVPGREGAGIEIEEEEPGAAEKEEGLSMEGWERCAVGRELAEAKKGVKGPER